MAVVCVFIHHYRLAPNQSSHLCLLILPPLPSTVTTRCQSIFSGEWKSHSHVRSLTPHSSYSVCAHSSPSVTAGSHEMVIRLVWWVVTCHSQLSICSIHVVTLDSSVATEVAISTFITLPQVTLPILPFLRLQDYNTDKGESHWWCAWVVCQHLSHCQLCLWHGRGHKCCLQKDWESHYFHSGVRGDGSKPHYSGFVPSMGY